MKTAMPVPVHLSSIVFAAAAPAEVEKGLLGRIQFILDGRFSIDGVAVRRTLDGRHVLSFPSRRDQQGYERFFIKPLDDDTRREVEYQVLSALGFQNHPTERTRG